MEQTEKQIKPPNERDLLQTSVTNLFFINQKQFPEAMMMVSENKKMEQTKDVLAIKAKVQPVPLTWWVEIFISNKIKILGSPDDDVCFLGK